MFWFSRRSDGPLASTTCHESIREESPSDKRRAERLARAAAAAAATAGLKAVGSQPVGREPTDKHMRVLRHAVFSENDDGVRPGT